MASTHELSTSSDDSLFISLVGGTEEETRALAEEHFDGGILEWAERRHSLLDDDVVPKILFIDNTGSRPHKVAWVEHRRFIPASREIFHKHHIICECVLCQDLNDGKGGIDTAICAAMGRALVARAKLVGKKFRPVIAASQENSVVNLVTGSVETVREFDVENFAMAAIEHVLQSDSSVPEEWHGNVVSGSLPIVQAARIVEQPKEVVVRIAELLERSGRITHDGEDLRLVA